jgi:hypothetical protein
VVVVVVEGGGGGGGGGGSGRWWYLKHTAGGGCTCDCGRSRRAVVRASGSAMLAAGTCVKRCLGGYVCHLRVGLLDSRRLWL